MARKTLSGTLFHRRKKLSLQTVLILINGPEYNFFKLSVKRAERYNSELRSRIIRLNQTMDQFAINNKQNVRVVDSNLFLTKKSDFTDFLFHWSPQKSFEIAKECLKVMSEKDIRKDYNFLERLPINDRKIVIWGCDKYAQICYYSLIVNGIDVCAVCYHAPCISDDFDIISSTFLDGNKEQYYLIT